MPDVKLPLVTKLEVWLEAKSILGLLMISDLWIIKDVRIIKDAWIITMDY